MTASVNPLLLERAQVCILAVWVVFDLWWHREPPKQFVEDMACLLMHSKSETFLDDTWAILAPIQGMTLYEAQQYLEVQRHGQDYKEVSSVWARIEAGVHFRETLDVVGT